MKFQNPSFKFFFERTFERDGIYVATFSYFGYFCGYLPMCGLDTQESILATKVSNLRNKSHLYSKMTTCVSNCPNFIATRVPIGLCEQTNKRTDKPKAICSPLFQSWDHKNAIFFQIFKANSLCQMSMNITSSTIVKCT